MQSKRNSTTTARILSISSFSLNLLLPLFSFIFIFFLNQSVICLKNNDWIVVMIFSYVKACHTLEDLDLLPKPFVVLCSFASLEFGYSRDIFIRWCINPNNLIIFTDRGNFSRFYFLSSVFIHSSFHYIFCGRWTNFVENSSSSS